jgi:hypothetical protein
MHLARGALSSLLHFGPLPVSVPLSLAETIFFRSALIGGPSVSVTEVVIIAPHVGPFHAFRAPIFLLSSVTFE